MSLAIIDKLYDNSSETDRNTIEGDFVDFTKHFKHLDSYISYHMKNDNDIGMRIAAGNRATSACSNY